MKKWKTGLIILSSLLVTVIGAVLPLCCHPDTTPAETYSFMSIPDYTIDQDRKPMTIPEKMELLRFGGQRISAPPDRMKHSENEIIAAVKDEFERYADKGILSAGLRCVESTTWPTMVFSMETGEKFDFFWEVTLILKNDSQRMDVFCVVDDETKKFLAYGFSAKTRQFYRNLYEIVYTDLRKRTLKAWGL